MRLPLILLSVTSLALCQPRCDLIEEATSLHCVSSLVSYAETEKQTLLHPPLSGIDTSCRKYAQYMTCTAGVHEQCRTSIAPNIESMYEIMCEESFLSIVREEKDCMVELERDVSLKACFVNRTNSLRDESLSTVHNSSSSYECLVIQSLVDCLLDRQGSECGDATKMQISLLSLLATRQGGSQCTLDTNTTRSRPVLPLEQCDRNGSCSCRLEGYYYDGLTGKCNDIDECVSSAPCSQKCQNTEGSFECHCERAFFHMDKDNRTCIRNDNDPLWLFFAHGQSIWNISADGKAFQLQRAGLQKTAMIDIDVQERRLYYADIGANSIERMNIEGTFPQIVQRMQVDGLEGIAVDWIGRNLYSLRRSDILVQTLDGRFRRPLYSDVMRLPRAIAVHPRIGQLFVTDWSSQAFIAVAAMDGSKFTKIITDRITWPNALAVDVHADRIYWADAFLDTIEMASLDGSGRRSVVADAGSVPHVFGLAVADQFIYWTDWTYRGLLRANKLTGDNITVLAQTALLPYSIKIFHPSIQPAEPSPCVSHGCQQLCLLSPSGHAKCACGLGFELTDDGKQCVSNCSSTQIECGGSDPKCISKLFMCDGIAHCENQADEAHCPPRICLPGQFQCHDIKKCVSPGGLCDGIPDCQDNSDEMYCEKVPARKQ